MGVSLFPYDLFRAGAAPQKRHSCDAGMMPPPFFPPPPLPFSMDGRGDRESFAGRQASLRRENTGEIARR